MIQHIVPVNDLIDHDEETSTFKNPLSCINGREEITISLCICEPRVDYIDNENILIIHNSLDGREGLELALEILNGFK